MKVDSDYFPLVAAVAFLIVMFISFAVSSAYETHERQETIREIVKTIRVLQEKGCLIEAQKMTNLLKEMK